MQKKRPGEGRTDARRMQGHAGNPAVGLLNSLNLRTSEDWNNRMGIITRTAGTRPGGGYYIYRIACGLSATVPGDGGLTG